MGQQGQQNPVAGFERFALKSVTFRRPPTNIPPAPRNPLLKPLLNSANSRKSRTCLPVSLLLFQVRHLRYMRLSIPPPALLGKILPMAKTDEAFMPFMGTRMSMTPPSVTPAYPAYPKNSTIPATPRAQAPLTTWGGRSCACRRSRAPP